MHFAGNHSAKTSTVAGRFQLPPEPATARALASRLEIHHAPKHGSWLNMAETELSVLSRQCLDRRIDGKETMAREVAVWEQNH